MRYAFALAAVILTAGSLVAAVELSGRHESSALPECAPAAAAIDRPATLPREFPVPAGTVFTRSFRNVTSHGVPAVTGVLPLRLGEAVSFFDRELPRAGMRVDVRIPKASGYEAFYSVKGFSGRYRVDEIRACPAATSLLITARPTLLGRGFSE
jgi:hypothetical protein